MLLRSTQTLIVILIPIVFLIACNKSALPVIKSSAKTTDTSTAKTDTSKTKPTDTSKTKPTDTTKTKPPVKTSPTDSLSNSNYLVSYANCNSGQQTAGFTYDSSNHLIKEIDTVTYNSTKYILVNAYAYNSSGDLVKREASDKYGDTTYNITYVNSQPSYATFKVTFTNYSRVDTGTIRYTVVGGKVTLLTDVYKGKSYKVVYNGENIQDVYPMIGNVTQQELHFTTGSKLSPFITSRFKWVLFADQLPEVENAVYYANMMFPVNIYNQNALESSSYVDPSGTYPYNYTNTYNSLGYLTSAGNGRSTIKYQYIRAHL